MSGWWTGVRARGWPELSLHLGLDGGGLGLDLLGDHGFRDPAALRRLGKPRQSALLLLRDLSGHVQQLRTVLLPPLQL